MSKWTPAWIGGATAIIGGILFVGFGMLITLLAVIVYFVLQAAMFVDRVKFNLGNGG